MDFFISYFIYNKKYYIKMALTLRSTNGGPLTIEQMDDNLTYLESIAGGTSSTPTNYTIYSALLTQTGTQNPLVEVLENTTGLPFDWIREDTGYYSYYGEGNLTKCSVNFPTVTNINVGNALFRVEKQYDAKSHLTVFVLNTESNGDAEDTMLYRSFIEIKIYE